MFFSWGPMICVWMSVFTVSISSTVKCSIYLWWISAQFIRKSVSNLLLFISFSLARSFNSALRANLSWSTDLYSTCCGSIPAFGYIIYVLDVTLTPGPTLWCRPLPGFVCCCSNCLAMSLAFFRSDSRLTSSSICILFFYNLSCAATICLWACLTATWILLSSMPWMLSWKSLILSYCF